MKEQIAVSWSGGKDCSLALFEILQAQQHEIFSLHTVFNQDTKRVGLHGIKQNLIEQQADLMGVAIDKIYLPAAESQIAYETVMNDYYRKLSQKGIRKVLFGDIFLEDLKSYREKMLHEHSLEGIFPLWKQNSRTIAEKFISSGFKAVICAVDATHFTEGHVGRDFDLDFINSLHPTVDSCGENGEFHTFVYDGPTFTKPIRVNLRQKEIKEYGFKVNLSDGNVEQRFSKFWFQELD